MSVRYSRYIPAISVAGDLVVLNLLFVVGYCYFFSTGNDFSSEKVLFYLFINVLWIILTYSFGADKITRNNQKKALFLAYLKIIVFFFFLFLLYFQVSTFNYYPRYVLKYLFPSLFVLILTWKFTLHYLFYIYRKHGYNYRNVIIVGHSERSQELAKYFSRTIYNGYRFLGFIDEEVDKKKKVVERYDKLGEFIQNQGVDEVYLNLERIQRTTTSNQ